MSIIFALMLIHAGMRNMCQTALVGKRSLVQRVLSEEYM